MKVPNDLLVLHADWNLYGNKLLRKLKKWNLLVLHTKSFGRLWIIHNPQVSVSWIHTGFTKQTWIIGAWDFLTSRDATISCVNHVRRCSSHHTCNVLYIASVVTHFWDDAQWWVHLKRAESASRVDRAKKQERNSPDVEERPWSSVSHQCQFSFYNKGKHFYSFCSVFLLHQEPLVYNTWKPVKCSIPEKRAGFAQFGQTNLPHQ